METFAHMAAVAADAETRLEAVRNVSPALHASLALAGLGIATVLAIYKPPGLTRNGWRSRKKAGPSPPPADS